MNTPLFVLMATLAAPPVAQVRLVRGETSVLPGTALESGTAIETSEGGFIELAHRSTTRVRIFSSTRVVLETDHIRLLNGRVWIQATSLSAPLFLSAPDTIAEVSARTSLIAEHTRLAGSAIAVRAGSIVLRGGQELRVREREVAVIAPGADGKMRVRKGGTGTAELAMREAELGLGDMLGLSKFLLAQAGRAVLGTARLKSVDELVRTDGEQLGSDARPGGIFVESALRPPPFFEEEVPPKGPNVRVEVTFGDD